MTDAAKLTVATWIKEAQIHIQTVEQQSRTTREAAEASAKSSQETMIQMQALITSARQASDESTKAARDAVKAARRAAQEAAKAWIDTFQELLQGAGEIGGFTRQVISETGQELKRPVSNAASKIRRANPVIDEQTAAPTTVPSPKPEPINQPPPRETLKNRMEMLEQMFRDSKNLPPEPADE